VLEWIIPRGFSLKSTRPESIIVRVTHERVLERMARGSACVDAGGVRESATPGWKEREG
jgi:hypothetical protein